MKDLNEIQAVPTEYKGLQFRSKSEALLARCWDIVSEKNPEGIIFNYEYEPEVLQLPDGYIPDFYLSLWHPQRRDVTCMIVEYKPSNVTDTYKEKIKDRFLNYYDTVCNNPFPKGFINFIVPALWSGSFYTNGKKTFEFLNPQGKWLEAHSWDGFYVNTEVIKQAKKYRFDLE